MADGRTFAARLSSTELAALTGRGRQVRHRAGELLMRQGDVGDHVVVLLSGLVKILSHDQHGGVRLLGIREPGELLGEMACLDGRPRSVTVQAASALAGVRVAHSKLFEFLDQYPRAALELARQTSRRLRDAERQQTALSTDSTELRVFRALAELCALYGRRAGGHQVTVPLTQTELAQLAGVSLMSAQRSLRWLRDRSLITTRYGHLLVPCAHRLGHTTGLGSANPVTRGGSCPRCPAG